MYTVYTDGGNIFAGEYYDVGSGTCVICLKEHSLIVQRLEPVGKLYCLPCIEFAVELFDNDELLMGEKLERLDERRYLM